MPVMKTWHVAGAQSNTHRFAGFVLGEDHVTLTEREEHERSSTIYPVRTEEDQEDSTWSLALQTRVYKLPPPQKKKSGEGYIIAANKFCEVQSSTYIPKYVEIFILHLLV